MNLIVEFINSGDAGWDITGNNIEMLSEVLAQHRDVLYVRHLESVYLLNRNCIGKPKILDPKQNGGINGNGDDSEVENAVGNEGD